MKDQVSWAWAIDSRSVEGHGLLGVGWAWPHAGQRLACQDGLRTMLFRTRAEAREVLLHRVRPKTGYQAFPKAQVVRVRIHISKEAHREGR